MRIRKLGKICQYTEKLVGVPLFVSAMAIGIRKTVRNAAIGSLLPDSNSRSG